MKEYYLSYNSINKNYYLDSGSFYRNRENLGNFISSDFVCNKIKQLIPHHRKSLLFLEDSINEEIKKCLENLFKNSRVHLHFVKDLKNIKNKK